MGWSYSPQWPTRAALVQYLRRPERFPDNLELVRACLVGSHHWYLTRERATGQHWIGLDLVQSGRADGWGYKDLDESVGPCAMDCPMAYLAAPHTERAGFAAQWRERVRAHHAARSARLAALVLVPGAWVSYGGRPYQLQSPAGSRRGWHVQDATGRHYRMQARQLAQAKHCPGHEPAQAAEAPARWHTRSNGQPLDTEE